MSKKAFVLSLIVGITGGLSLGLLSSCTDKEPPDLSKSIVNPLDDSTVILEYTNGKITVGDVKQKVHPEFEKAREKILNAYIQAAEERLIEQSADRFENKDIEVTEAEVQNFIKANKLTQSKPEEIHTFLVNEKKRIQKQVAKADVFNQLNVKNKLGAARFDLGKTKDLPQQGPSGAPVTIQYFCDFGNPICARSRVVLQEIRTEFPEKVRTVFRHFPVPSNAMSKEASLFSICAHEKGKFWEMHDKLFDNQAQLSVDKMKALSTELGLKDEETEKCVTAPSTMQVLDQELKEAQSLGITSTPVFFVNGTKVSEFEQLKNLVRSKTLN